MRCKWLRFLSATLAVVLAGCGAVTNNRGSVNANGLTGNFSAVATPTMTSMSGSMPSPMLSFTFSMAEATAMMNSGGSSTVSVSNLNFAVGSNCFDNMASATAMVTGMMGSSRTLTLQLSENGNMAVFSMAVSSNNSSASGNFALTGGHMLGGSMTACIASASGTASFSRM